MTVKQALLRFLFRALLGPLGPGRAWWSRGLGLLLAVLLTLATQVGGVLLWLCYSLDNLLGRGRRWARGAGVGALFLASYAAATFVVLPAVAPSHGRERLPCFEQPGAPYAAASWVYCAANRTYASATIRATLDDLSRHLADRFPGSRLTYLDAGFPFLDNVDMPPHPGRDDGNWIDLALFYRDRPAAGAWPLGYFAYAPARRLETEPVCIGIAGWRRQDLDGIQDRFAGLDLDIERNRAMVAYLADERTAPQVRRVATELYLKDAFGVTSDIVRFAGCDNIRHDDHIAVAVR